MDVVVFSVNIRFLGQDYFIWTFDLHGCDNVEYSEEAESIEAYLEVVL